MTDKISDIVIPLLRRIQADMAEIKADLPLIRDDLAAIQLTLSRIDERAKRFRRFLPEGEPLGCFHSRRTF